MTDLSMTALADVLVRKNGLDPQEAARFVDAIFDIIKDGLEQDKQVKIKGLGTFKIIGVDARESVNVNTGERVLINSHSKITFTPDNTMKELVNKPFSQFETVVLNEGVDFDDIDGGGEGSAEESQTAEPQVEETPVADAVDGSVVDNPAEEVLIAENTVIPDVSEDIIDNMQASESSDDAETAVPVAEETVSYETISEDVEAEPTETVTEDIVPTESVEEKTEPANDIIEPEETEKPSHLLAHIISGVVVVLLIAGAAYGGYRYGRYEAETELKNEKTIAEAYKSAELSKRQAKQTPEDTLKAVPLDATEIGAMKVNGKKDSLDKAQQNAAEAKPVQQLKQKTEEKKPAAKPAETPKADAKKAAATVTDYSKYEQMDARVRTGAYRIVGTDRVVKVKEGETLSKISRNYLGEGMECYVEVYNGIKASTRLKAGTEIKIPKLELKRKKKSN